MLCSRDISVRQLKNNISKNERSLNEMLRWKSGNIPKDQMKKNILGKLDVSTKKDKMRGFISGKLICHVKPLIWCHVRRYPTFQCLKIWCDLQRQDELILLTQSFSQIKRRSHLRILDQGLYSRFLCLAFSKSNLVQRYSRGNSFVLCEVVIH